MVAGFVVRIPEAIYTEMAAHVVAGFPNEACGALGTKDGRVVKHYPTANAAEHPDDFSIIGDADLLRIYEDIDEYDGEMIYYHSHPKSEKPIPPNATKSGRNATNSTILSSLTSTTPNHPMPGCTQSMKMIR